MNKAIIIGNLTRDPDLKSTQSGIPVASFTVAVNRRFKNANGEQETDYINIVAWRQLAELCGKYLKKGNKVGITGSIQTRKYTDKNGVERTATEILADEAEFLTPKSTRESRTEFEASELEDFTPPADGELPF